MSDTDLAFRATLDGSGFASGMQSINGQLSDMGIRTNSATASLGPLGTLMGSMATPMTAVALGATAVGAALASSVGVAAGFQQSMANVNSVLGGGQEQFEQLSAVAREAGASTIFSASQAADALYFMASAGMNAGQASAALKDTLNLAAAGNLDLAQASEIVTGTLAQFSLRAEDAGRVANVLAAGASATNSDVAQLGQAMQNAGPMAANLGMSIEQTTAALGIFANSNIKGAEAGTALKSMLGSMLTATKEGSTALAEMGLTYDDINPSMHSYGEIMSTLNEKHMTASQSVKIFGKEMASNALVAVKGASDYDTLTQKITGTDKAAEMAAIQTNTMQGSMKELSSAVEEAQIALGNTLIPGLTAFIDTVTWAVTASTNFGKSLYSWGQSADTALLGWSEWLTGLGFGGAEEEAEKAAYMISDTYVESTAEGIKAAKEITADAIVENLGGADAQKAATKAGETTAETFAKSQAAWIKESGWMAEQGATRQPIYSTEEGKEKEVVGYTPWSYTGYTTPTPAEAWKPTTPLPVSLEAGWDKGEIIRLITQRAGALSEYIDSEGNKRFIEAKASEYIDYAGNTFKDVQQQLANKYNYTEQEAAALIWSYKGDTSLWKALMQRDAQGFEDFKAQYADIESQSKEILAGRTERIVGEETAAHRQEQLDAWLKSLPLDMQRVSIAAKNLMFDVQQSMTAIAPTGGKINPEPWTVVFDALSQDVIKDTDWPRIDDALEIMAKSGADPALVNQAKEYLKSKIEEVTDISIGLRYKLNWEEFWLKNKDAALKGLTDSQMFDIFNMEGLVKNMGPGVQHAWEIMWQGLESPSKEMEPLVTDAIKSMIGIIPNFTPELAQALIDLYVGGIQEAKPSIIDALTGVAREINSISLADLLKNPEELTKSVSNWPQWIENTFQPTLKKSFDDIYRVSQSGYDTDIKASQDWIAEKEKIFSQHSSWFKGWQADLLNMYSQNRISAEDMLWVWDQMENKSTKTVDSLNNQAVGYNQLQKAMEDCADCAISDFGEWQEAQDNLFGGAYIGAGGEGYLAWERQRQEAIAATQLAMRASGGVVVGKDYTTSQLLSYQLDIDTSPAESKLEIIQTNIKMSDIKMPVDLATETAEASKATLQTSIETTKPIMEVQLETSAAYAAANALYSAISSMVPVVYVDVIPLISAADIAAMISAELGGAVA
jgi:TP901 family phage tail tape measure protein